MREGIEGQKKFYQRNNCEKIASLCLLHTLLFFSFAFVFAEDGEQAERARYVWERYINSLATAKPIDIKEEKQGENKQVLPENLSVYVKEFRWIKDEKPPISLKDILNDYENRKISGKELKELLQLVNQRIQKEGYVTTKVIIAPQHIQRGVVYFTLQKGIIHEFIYSKGSVHIPIAQIFPHGQDEWMNIRDLEQGVEHIRNVPGETVEMKIIPLKDHSADILLYVTRGKLWQIHGNLEYNGKKPYTIRGRLDIGNPFHLQDVLSFQVGRNIGYHRKYKDYQQFSIAYRIPYRKFNFSFRTAYLINGQPLDVGEMSYPHQTKTKENVFKIEKMVKRDNQRKAKYFISYHTYERRNTIGNTDIRVQRINKSDITMGATYQQYFSQGQCYGLYSVTKNVRQKNEIGGMRNYLIHQFDFSYVRYLTQNRQYQGLFHGQIGMGRIYDTDEIAIGGLYTVRGYNGAKMLSGKSGWYIQQECQWRKGNHEPYVAWDIGNIKTESGSSWLSGMTVGVRGYKGISYDIAISTPLIRPRGWEKDKIVMYANIGMDI